MNGGDAEATERFKEINRAYEVLSNPDKRARYDRYGAAAVDPDQGGTGAGMDFGFGGFGDIFDVLFGAGGRAATTQRGPERGADLRCDVEITLEEVLTGASKQVSVTRLETCTECKGNGARPGTRPQPCVVCGGAGAVRSSRQTIFGTMSQVSECYHCHGRGEVIKDHCPRCGGRGRERQTRRVPVNIPPGIEERVRLQISGWGEAGPYGGPPGDLYVFVRIKPHPQFRRQGREVTSEVE